MENENRNEAALGDQIQVRRDKLAQLQADGRDPFVLTKFDVSTTSQYIKDHFDELEGKRVSVAGRLMSKRGMGKVSF